MSLASVRSSRGDNYEILIAARWAIRMLSGVDIERVTVDSTELDVSGEFVVVDDVVVASRNGKRTYCQCKKNQTDFDSWKVADLADDLKKAAKQLTRDSQGAVVFYSAVPFGEMQKLQEHSNAFPDSDSFRISLAANKGLSKVADALTVLWSEWIDVRSNTLFSLLRRISFEVTPSQTQLSADILEGLRLHVTRADDVLDALTARLNRLKSRTTVDAAETTPVASLTRKTLLQLIAKAGAAHAPPRDEVDLLREFRLASSVGRAWRRDIGSRKLMRPALGELLDHVSRGVKRVLISDGPGAGKTCLLLDLVDRLEEQSDRAVLFVQGREFADAASDAERGSLGLVPNLLNSVGRMAEYRPVVVVLDSIDVLSLSREHSSLNFFLAVIDQLAIVPNVTVIAACRRYDLKYDRRLTHREWDRTVNLGPLDWNVDVLPLLNQWRVDVSALAERLRVTLTNPRMLAIFEELVRDGQVPAASTAQELTELYLETIVSRDPSLGDPAMLQLEALGQQMLMRRRLSVSQTSARLPQEIKTSLLSNGVIVENASRGIEFGHQTLLDVLIVRAAIRSGATLISFVRAHAATPFLRPTVRSFLFHLRSTDPGAFRAQVRAITDANDIAFHLKRLVAESLAEIEPTDDDWRLVSHLSSRHSELFRYFFFAARGFEWFGFFRLHWWPVLVAKRNVEGMLLYAHHLDVWVSTSPRHVLPIFLEILRFDWLPHGQAAGIVYSSMQHWTDWTAPQLEEVFAALIDSPLVGRSLLGRNLAEWVCASNSGDELLWRYIVGDVTSEDVHYRRIGSKLRCRPDYPGTDRAFLAKRMRDSEALLNLAVAEVDGWSRREFGEIDTRDFHTGFLHETSYSESHARYDMKHVDGGGVLLGAIEAACLQHAASDTAWWRENVSSLLQSADGGLRYIALRAVTAEPAANLACIATVLRDPSMLEYGGDYEIGQLLNASFHLLERDVQDEVLTHLMTTFERLRGSEFDGDWIQRKRRNYLDWIPSFLRSPAADTYLDELQTKLGNADRKPLIERSGGWVPPPFEYKRFVELSPAGVVRVLRHYSRGYYGEDFLRVGGPDAVAAQLSEAASRYPVRFLTFLAGHWPQLDDRFGAAILSGISRNISHRFGNLSSTGEWKTEEEPPGRLLAKLALDELDRHPVSWGGTRAAAEVLDSSSHVIDDDDELSRFIFHLVTVSLSPDPQEEGDDLATTALNGTRGNATQAAAVVATRWAAAAKPIPAMLGSTLRRLASDTNRAVRFAILRYLPHLQQVDPELGWSLFNLATQDADAPTWSEAEPCLYYSYHSHFERVSPYLALVYGARAFESWAHIACLACLSGHVSTSELSTNLIAIDDEPGWTGAARVFATNAGNDEHRTLCLGMLVWVLQHSPPSTTVANEVDQRLFDGESPVRGIPEPLLRAMFAFRNRVDQTRQTAPASFLKWLAAVAYEEPDEALLAVEIMLEGTQWSDDMSLFFEPATLSALFQEAEEREESDGGKFLRRVVAVQDVLLRLSGSTLHEWLKDAERP
ncbi:ATP-binding protein [Paraburkholderia sp. IMGN_8]|uniref:ATP-binding protein n=1 Tax=Paraburkholderia sp. IMGN_8 TaxID=3136564 RepID=UPI003100DA9F